MSSPTDDRVRDSRLAATVERYGVAFDAALAGMTLEDVEGALLRVNPSMCRLLGRSAEALAGVPTQVVTHPDDRGAARAFRAGALAGGGDRAVVEQRYLRPDGTLVWAEVNVSLVRDDDGTPLCFFSQVLDVSDRVDTERALARQVEFVHLLQTVSASANASSLDEALGTTLREVCRATGWVLAHAWLVPADASGLLVSSGTWHAEPGLAGAQADVARVTRLAAGEELPGRVLATGRPSWVELLYLGAPTVRTEAALAHGLRSAFACPVRTGAEVGGVLEFFSHDLRPVDEELLALADHLGTQLGRLVEREAWTRALHRSERRLRRVLETSEDAFVAMDATGRVTEWNPEAERMFGCPREEAVGRPVVDLVVPVGFRGEARPGRTRAHSVASHVPAGRRAELHVQRRDGTEVPVEASLSAARVGEELVLHGFFRDISERVELHRRLEDLAMLDELTHVPNRRGFLREARRVREEVRRTGEALTLLWVDLDNMKEINDEHGHDVGDDALRAMAGLLTDTFRAEDVVARLGGDEFCALLRTETVDAADALVERLRAAVDAHVALPYPLRCSMGVASLGQGPAEGRDHGADELEDLIRAADQAMYEEKRAKRAPAVPRPRQSTG